MTDEEIDDKIEEFIKKLNAKKTVEFRKGFKARKIPPHLKKYYHEEIKKLEKLKEILQNSITSKIAFSWHEVIFEDYKILLKKHDKLYGPVKFSNSRKSFEFLKPYFKKLNLEPIEALIENNKVIEISNLENISQVIHIFKFKDLITNFSKYDNSDFNHCIGQLNNQQTISITKLSNKSQFFKHLISINGENYKIIPLLENSDLDEDSFIFTKQEKNVIYLIWESVLDNKATYVFSMTDQEYSKSLFRIIKFILSKQITRMDIRQSFIKEKLDNITCSLIYHTGVTEWKNKIKKKTS